MSLLEEIRQALDAVHAALETHGQLPTGHMKLIEATLERCLDELGEGREAA